MSLRTTLSTLRRECGPAAQFVVATRERVGIEAREDLWIDARAADGLVADGLLEQALELRRRGELLADLDDDWVLEARDVHRSRLCDVVGMLGDVAEAAGDLGAAVRYAREQREIEPLSEEVARTLIRRLAAAGDRAGAIAAFESFRERLRGELGIAPSAETRTLIDGVHAETAERPALWLAPPASLVREEPVALVGRSVELERMALVWRSASAGDLRVLVLRGEAGSGKIRLLGALASDAHAGGATVLAGRCFADAVAIRAVRRGAARLRGPAPVAPRLDRGRDCAASARRVRRLAAARGGDAAQEGLDGGMAAHQVWSARGVAAAVLHPLGVGRVEARASSRRRAPRTRRGRPRGRTRHGFPSTTPGAGRRGRLV